ncbi:nuclear transport factor 2 family protein [Streptomyces sp. NPDC006879]|uniref:nuclear transport factor 2 family protein n=1 Tax=Streptomyces sp. NPDC006879 TaxID=3364767 RepID=UPI0036777264
MTKNQSSAEVAELLDRYLINLDDDKLDEEWARSLFTEDVVIEFPNARHQGLAGIAEWHGRSMAAFESTQHLNSPALVVLDGEDGEGDRATLRANLISTHVHLPANRGLPGGPVFAAGTFVTGAARRTAEGWRLSALSFRMSWATGSPPPAS